VQVRLVVERYKKEEEAKDTCLVEGAGNKSSHEGPKVSMGGYSVEPNIGREADVSSHEDFIAQGFRLFKEEEEG